jgi:lysophospholipase L1-like esterase
LQNPIERVVLGNGDEVLLSADEQGRLMKGWARPGTPDAREILLDPLERLRTDVAAQGARLLVVLMPSKEEIHGAAQLPELLRVAEEARRELHRRGFAVVDLYPAFRAESRVRAAFFRADPHPNDTGHRLMAQALAKAIGTP